MTMTCQCPQLTEQGARDTGYNIGPRSDHYAHGFRLIASTLLNDEGTFGNRNAESRSPPPFGVSMIVLMNRDRRITPWLMCRSSSRNCRG